MDQRTGVSPQGKRETSETVGVALFVRAERLGGSAGAGKEAVLPRAFFTFGRGARIAFAVGTRGLGPAGVLAWEGGYAARSGPNAQAEACWGAPATRNGSEQEEKAQESVDTAERLGFYS